jgi:hypothetical protein
MKEDIKTEVAGMLSALGRGTREEQKPSEKTIWLSCEAASRTEDCRVLHVGISSAVVPGPLFVNESFPTAAASFCFQTFLYATHISVMFLRLN